MCLGQLNWVNWIIRFEGLEIETFYSVSVYRYKSEKDKDQPHSMRSRARRVQMSKHKLRSICIYHLKSEIIVCRAVRPRGRGPWDSNELPTLYAGHVITFVTWIRVPNLTLTRALLKFNWKFSSEIYTLVPIGHQPDVNKWQNQETNWDHKYSPKRHNFDKVSQVCFWWISHKWRHKNVAFDES